MFTLMNLPIESHTCEKCDASSVVKDINFALAFRGEVEDRTEHSERLQHGAIFSNVSQTSE